MQHSSTCNNYKYHVIRFGIVNHCNGCFANTIFLAFLLPIYFLAFFLTNYPPMLYGIIIAYIGIQLPILMLWSFSGKRRFGKTSGYMTISFLIYSHYFVMFGSYPDLISPYILGGLILCSVIPQFSIYTFKIISRDEFKFPKLKLLIRMVFIHGYLFSLMLFKYNPLLSLFIISTTAPTFYWMRKISSTRILLVDFTEPTNSKTTNGLNSTKLFKSWNFDNFEKSPLVHNIAAEQDSCCGECCSCSVLGAGVCISCGY